MKITKARLRQIIKEEILKESKNRITRNQIKRKAMEMIKQPGGISRMDLESGLKDHFSDQLEKESDFQPLEDAVEDTLQLDIFNKYYNEKEDHYSI